jgi:hypothetical protein
MPPDKIIFPRHMLYVEAVLYLLIALASFSLGYLIGHNGNGNAKPPSKDVASRGADKPVPLTGTVTFGPLSGTKQPDDGAVVIVLPADKWPDRPLAAAGFRPDDSPPGPKDANLRALTALGGAIARAGSDGRVSLVVPRPGSYRFLVLSRHVKRQTGDPLPSFDLQDLSKYFDEPRDLFLRNRYHWFSARLVQAGASPIPFDFDE